MKTRSETIMESETVSRPPAVRGTATRDALVDAAEALIADHGFRTPSHRHIAGEAGVHVALINYHFSTKELLFETAVERRSGRLTQAWRDALQAARAQPTMRVEDVLRAWWRPFGEMHAAEDPTWRNYLCVIARLSSASYGDEWHQRYFGPIERDFQRALADALPEAASDDIEAGFRYARTLFSEVLLHLCGKTGSGCVPRGYREDDTDRLLRFMAHGMQALVREVDLTSH
jgi:AcrR family transcriptional regulator